MSRGLLLLTLLLAVTALTSADPVRSRRSPQYADAASRAALGSTRSRYGLAGSGSPLAGGARVWQSRNRNHRIGLGVSSDFNRRHAVGLGYHRSIGRNAQVGVRVGSDGRRDHSAGVGFKLNF